MHRFLLFLLAFTMPSLYAADRILNYNIYDRTDRVDVMLTFEVPYEGRIKQNATKNKISIKLDDATIESQKIKKLSNTFLNQIIITPFGDNTEIVAQLQSSDVRMNASKTADGFGLRLRFIKEKNAAELAQESFNDALSSLPTKNTTGYEYSYTIVGIILVTSVLIILLLKIRNAKMQGESAKTWLAKFKKDPKDNVSIRFQKALDPKNRVVMLDYGKQSYLVIIGNTNMLLDTFEENTPKSKSEFDEMLTHRKEELDNYMRLGNITKEDALQSYKERASGH